MSTMDDIRAHMARQADPVTPAQVAEALELEGTKVRQAMRQAAIQGAGIEALDDGTYSLIPGWKPSRKAAASDTETPPAAAPRAAKAKAKRGPKPRKAAKGTKVREAKAAARPAPVKRTPAAARGETVEIPRVSLNCLVDAVLASEMPITGPVRAALREASSCAARG